MAQQKDERTPIDAGRVDPLVRRIGWSDMERQYVGRRYRGRINGRQWTVKVVDVTLGGDVVVRNLKLDHVWKQAAFLAFVATAKQLT